MTDKFRIQRALGDDKYWHLEKKKMFGWEPIGYLATRELLLELKLDSKRYYTPEEWIKEFGSTEEPKP